MGVTATCRRWPCLQQIADSSVDACSNLPLVSEVARTLAFAPALHELANQIIYALTDHGTVAYNAAHLRIEKDARDWSIIMGGDGVSENIPAVGHCMAGLTAPSCAGFPTFLDIKL